MGSEMDAIATVVGESQYRIAGGIIPPVDLPEASAGNWSIRRFTVSDADARRDNMMSMIHGRRRSIRPGTYTGLYHRGAVWMSDTPDEMRDHAAFVMHARGDVLITGLGLGMAVAACLERSAVASVTVIEVDEDVIRLVAPTLMDRYADKQLTIFHADALTWHPGALRFDSVWHDIWQSISQDNIPTMQHLHRRYARWLQAGGTQDSWCRDLLLYERRRYR